MKNRAIVDQASLKNLQAKKESLQRIETFPYSENLGSVMDSGIYTCSPEISVREAVRQMTVKGISSVVVVDGESRPLGILTEKDVIRRVVAVDGVDIETTTVGAVMTREPVVLRPENTIYRALAVQSSRGIKHLPLVEDGRLVGIVTLRQLLKLRYPEPMMLVEEIKDASATEALRLVKEKIPKIVHADLGSGRNAYDIVIKVSLINRDLHRRVLELALEQMGAPPVPFCMYVTGSHGRLENLLTPDQDHGMIIADNDGERQYDEYFVELTSLFSANLDRVGFVKCPGYIMSSNPLWRKSLQEWKQQVTFWMETQVREMGRFCTVLFDAAPMHGDRRLFGDLMDFSHGLLGRHREVLRVMHEEEGGHQVPTGFFGRFITERRGGHRGELEVKRSGLLFVVEGIRILALLHGIRATSTTKRIIALVDGGFVHADDGEYFEAAYLFLLHLALETQVEKMLAGQPVDTYLNPNQLSRRDRETLRHAYKAVSALQDLVATEFGELVL